MEEDSGPVGEVVGVLIAVFVVVSLYKSVNIVREKEVVVIER